jgi:outer membrane protein OmpA-like peptidoglycan-associated protein
LKSSHYVIVCLAVPFLAGLSSGQQDAAGCKDSPVTSRFPGSVISSCTQKPDATFEFTLQTGPKKRMEGEFEQIKYQAPRNATKDQVISNLNTALKKAGYSIMYESSYHGELTAHKGGTWMQIQTTGGNSILETVVKETPGKAKQDPKDTTAKPRQDPKDTTAKPKQDVPVADAAALSNTLMSSGHAVVNGIFFDTAKSDVKPDSVAALQEIAKLMQQNPQLKLYVVGHTDNSGSLSANMELSRRRAAAVAQVLSSKYGIASDRLSAYGDGPYSPLASNDTEQGRAMNRRVELVKQ